MTQLLWAKSREVGCGAAKSADNRIYVVCNYNPPGNVVQFFERNVPDISEEDIQRAKDEKKAREKEVKRFLEEKSQRLLDEQMQRMRKPGLNSFGTRGRSNLNPIVRSSSGRFY